MGTARRTEKVKLIVGLISNKEALFDRAKDILKKKLKDELDFESPVLEFAHTDYYNEEMGQHLKRKFLSFKRLLSLDGIEKIKHLTNGIERKLSVGPRRAVNIDPGYLDLSKVVLFSTKDYTHRIHIANGIFAEVTLFYKDKRFNPWPWTYPDYRTPSYLAVFDAVRDIYKRAGKD